MLLRGLSARATEIRERHIAFMRSAQGYDNLSSVSCSAHTFIWASAYLAIFLSVRIVSRHLQVRGNSPGST